MTERPIIFSADMVRAILAGKKTQTRRVINPQPVDEDLRSGCPYGVPGDRLWVRETCERKIHFNFLTGEPTEIFDAVYSADQEHIVEEMGFNLCPWFKKRKLPAIHMPRWASRLTLEIVSVRVERLQDITEADAKAEGVTGALVSESGDHAGFVPAFALLWDSLNGKRGYSWASNPWVWVITFRRLTP